MVIGGYALDLYCDLPEEGMSEQERWEHMGSSGGHDKAQFTHSEPGSAARSAPKRAGYGLDFRGNRQCPLGARPRLQRKACHGLCSAAFAQK